jgi:hypothetical protein
VVEACFLGAWSYEKDESQKKNEIFEAFCKEKM